MYKPRVVWLQAITCNGNTHSFLSANSTQFEQFLELFELYYHPSLTENKSLEDVISLEKIDYLLIEGAISQNENFYQVSGYNLKKLLNLMVSKSKYIIAVGACASHGGIHKKFLENDDILGIQSHLKSKKYLYKLINLPGCPINPKWLFQTLYMLKKGIKLEVDREFRPKEIYSKLAHHGCTRNEYFEWKIEAENFGEHHGCLFYNQGCRGPMTYSNCNEVLWNDVSSKTRAGVACIGCTEKDFPRDNMLETKKNIGIPSELPLGVSKRAYLSLVGVAKTFKIERLTNKKKQNIE